MIGFVCGIPGTGKTRRMVDMANAILKDSLGKTVFVDDNSDRMFDLKHAIRLVDAGEYDIHECDEFYAFLAGLAAGDFDIHTIFVDSIFKIIDKPLSELLVLFERLGKLGQQHDVRFVVAISAEDSELPDYIKERRLDLD